MDSVLYETNTHVFKFLFLHYENVFIKHGYIFFKLLSKFVMIISMSSKLDYQVTTVYYAIL